MKQQRPFVLSGGGVRGVAHLGVLRAMAEMGVVPNAISGTSAGALVGALIADGYSPREVLDLVLPELRRSLFIRRRGLASRRIRAFLQEVLRHRTFEELEMPLYVSATNLEEGGQHVISRGELVPALMASSAIPLVFPPVMVDGVYHVDGGMSNNLPVEPFRTRMDEVVAVHVNPLPVFDQHKRGMLRTMDRIWHLNFREMVMRSAKGCHLFVEPPELERFNMFELGKAPQIEEIGYDWTIKLLERMH